MSIPERMRQADEMHSAMLLQKVQRGKSARSMLTDRPPAAAIAAAATTAAVSSPPSSAAAVSALPNTASKRSVSSHRLHVPAAECEPRPAVWRSPG